MLQKGMELIINIFSLVGSLALFLFGMKTMSEGLEKFAGDRLRSILAAMTKNRVMGVLTGILITALIQSSSATTVMVVSFVNAGLMTLAQSIGVIMGANIGTTVTAWIISAVGFKVNIAAFAIPLLAIGMPLIFSGKGNRKSIGEFVFGFSFLFMGLSFLQEAATAMNIGDMVAGMLAHVPQDSFFTIILFIIVGALVTMIVQYVDALRHEHLWFWLRTSSRTGYGTKHRYHHHGVYGFAYSQHTSAPCSSGPHVLQCVWCRGIPHCVLSRL